jgi:hypothetical protein
MKLYPQQTIAILRALQSAQSGCSCAHRNALAFRSDRREGGFA